MSHAYNIAVDLDVFKTLTSMIEAEGQDHNAVLREILRLDSPVEAEVESTIDRINDRLAHFSAATYDGFFSRGLLLPDGTVLKARYKGLEYSAAIQNRKWINADGREFGSPSAAASAITGTTVNGWRFWEAKRPGDRGWRRLDVIQGTK